MWRQTVLDRILGFEVLPDRHEVVKEKLAKDFANVRYDQPYQYALYNFGVLMESKRWHIVDDYEAVLPGATPQQLQVRAGGWVHECGCGGGAAAMPGGHMIWSVPYERVLPPGPLRCICHPPGLLPAPV